MEERQTLCNMAIEAGGKNGIIPADDVTKKYVDARNAGNRPYTVSSSSLLVEEDDGIYLYVCKVPFFWLCVLRLHRPYLSTSCCIIIIIIIIIMQIFQADPDATYHSKFAYDLANLEPVVAKPHSPDNKELAKNCRDIKVKHSTSPPLPIYLLESWNGGYDKES